MTDKIDKTITPDALKNTLEHQYYTQCIQFRTQRTDEQVDESLRGIMRSITKIEKAYVVLQMFEHCAVCRDVNAELVQNLDLVISV